MPDSNPFGVLAQAGARVATDAGGNSLVRIAANGDISTLAIFPGRPQGRGTDAVPTSVVLGPDGAYYVGELSGAPAFAAGAARVYRVLPCAPPEIFADGLQTIIDIDFGPDGSLYVLQHTSALTPQPPNPFAGPGVVIRIAPDGTRSQIPIPGLIRPTSLLVEWDGTIYVTHNAVTVGAGEVWRVEQ